MIFREDFGRKYEASNGRSGERKVRTRRAGSQRVRGATLVISFGSESVAGSPRVDFVGSEPAVTGMAGFDGCCFRLPGGGIQIPAAFR